MVRWQRDRLSAAAVAAAVAAGDMQWRQGGEGKRIPGEILGMARMSTVLPAAGVETSVPSKTAVGVGVADADVAGTGAGAAPRVWAP